ncbi:MAG: YifB family Mg chelatase-like AAA ATPase [Chitinophagales bacterium]
MFATVKSLVINGIEAFPVQVEVDVQNGLPAFDLVGLPSAAIREAKERVRSAIKNSGFEFPLKRITVNLAPADLRKEGTHLDLPIAMGILLAVEQIEATCDNMFWAGEVSLDGSVKGVPGILPMILALSKRFPDGELLIPDANQGEASILDYRCRLVPNLADAVSYVRGDASLPFLSNSDLGFHPGKYDVDLADIKGQAFAKRALEVAVAGGHNLLMVGPPGSGKTMLARRIPSIMPDMTKDEILETTQIYSVGGLLNTERPLITTRPFRAPHRNASAASIIGGGRIPRPGEISLAQHGVLFLDEVTEFSREVLESLRQPLEDRTVTVTRAHSSSTYPCNMMLVAACNPCPCGYLGDSERSCNCTPTQVSRYFGRISGPLMDRMDLQVEVPRVPYEHLVSDSVQESSRDIKARIEEVRRIQTRRFSNRAGFTNARMKSRDLKMCCKLDEHAESLLRSAFKSLKLSARGYDRVLKVARTVADLSGSESIHQIHIAEAIQYRGIDRRYFSL